MNLVGFVLGALIVASLIAVTAGPAHAGARAQEYRCSASSELGGGKSRALVVTFRCNIDLVDVTFSSRSSGLQVKRRGWTVPSSNDRLRCASQLKRVGSQVSCKGRRGVFAKTPTRYRVAVRVRGDRCAVSLRLRAFGGPLCSGSCTDLGLNVARRIPKPRSC